MEFKLLTFFPSFNDTSFCLIINLLESGAFSVYVLSSFMGLLLCLSLVLSLFTFYPVLFDYYFA